MFTFTPLLGAQSASAASSSLLEFDNGIKILVDAGWDSSFDRAQLAQIEKHINTLSIILLTHATIEHLGAYAQCCKHVPGFSKVPTYATTPVANLGRTLTIDLYKSAPPAASLLPRNGFAGLAASDDAPDILLPPPTQDEIASYFSRIYPLKYSQPHQPIPSPFSQPLNGLTITAYGAGHTLGGTIWHIQYGMESIVYAANWSQAKENLLDGARMLEASGDEVIEPLQRPTAFVCSSRGVERTNVVGPKKRDDVLISLIRETIAQGGKVLIPTDSSARLLELAFVLNTAWRENIDGPHAALYKDANVYMATRSSKTTLRYLQSMLEWVEPSVAQQGEAAMTNTKGSVHPLHWNHIKQIETKAQVERALSRRRPGVLLASDASIEWGLSRHALHKLAADPRNLIILTEETSGDAVGRAGLGRQLWDFYRSQQGSSSASGNAKIVGTEGQVFTMQEATTADLSSDEGLIYKQYLARQEQLHSTMQGDSTLDDNAVVGAGDEQADNSSDSEDEDDDAEYQGRALNLSAQMTQNKRKVGLTDAELGVNILLKGKGTYDFDVRQKRGREKVFPYVAHRSRADEFGDLIKPEDYLRAEERDDIDGLDMRNGSKSDSNATSGLKRKWDDAATSKTKTGDSTSPKKKRVDGKEGGPDGVDAAIARATGEGPGAGTNGLPAHPDDSGSEDGDEEEESDYEPDDDGPKKVNFSNVDLTLQLRIAHVDYSGLAALTDIVNIVSMIRPRKLIISTGASSETQLLAEKCQPIVELASAEILTPAIGETVEASMDTNAWTLKLSPELLRQLEWQSTDSKGGEMRIASVSGLLAAAEAIAATDDSAGEATDETSGKKVKLATGAVSARPSANSAEDAVPTLPLLRAPPLVSSTTAIATATAAHPVRVGDLRLLDLRANLAALGHDVAVRGLGTLLIDGSVVVRKIPATGRLEIECANSGFARARGRTLRILPGAPGAGSGALARQVVDTRGAFFGVREEVEKALALVK